jgi:hypothetical protein
VDQNDRRPQYALGMSAAYTSNDFAAWEERIAEDAPIMGNDATMSRAGVIEAFFAGHGAFDGITHEDLNFTTMLDKNGTVFTITWYAWPATAKATGEALSVGGDCWTQW